MSKYTVTIYELLASEGYKNGFNDFVAPDGLHLINYGDNLAFVNKVNAFDTDIQKWSNKVIFGGNSLSSAGADKFFKREFISRFINREIKYQTVDIWRIKLAADMVKFDQWMSNTYDSFARIYTNEKDGKTTGNLLANQVNTSNVDFTGKVTSTSTNNTDTTTTSRHSDLDTTLPQNETNIDLNSDVLGYADTRKDSKDKGTTNTKQTAKGETDTKNVTNTKANQDTKQDTIGTSFDINFDIDTVDKIYRVYNPIFNELDRKLFLQIW